MATTDNSPLEAAETAVQSHSTGLRRELGLLDLILAQILLVIVPDFFGTAVKAGPAHVVLWLSAMVLFFIPLALIVAHLNRLMPFEGGLYEWARLAFNDRNRISRRMESMALHHALCRRDRTGHRDFPFVRDAVPGHGWPTTDGRYWRRLLF